MARGTSVVQPVSGARSKVPWSLPATRQRIVLVVLNLSVGTPHTTEVWVESTWT